MTEIITKKSRDTFLLGKRFSKRLKIGDVVCFYGGLGTGKTCFIKGVCKGLGIKNNVISPSFTIINEYSGDFIIYHIDFYRIEKIGELKELGFEEYLYNNGICLIEWADKVESFLPQNKIIVRMEFVKDKNNWRRIKIEK